MNFNSRNEFPSTCTFMHKIMFIFYQDKDMIIIYKTDHNPLFYHVQPNIINRRSSPHELHENGKFIILCRFSHFWFRKDEPQFTVNIHWKPHWHFEWRIVHRLSNNMYVRRTAPRNHHFRYSPPTTKPSKGQKVAWEANPNCQKHINHPETKSVNHGFPKQTKKNLNSKITQSLPLSPSLSKYHLRFITYMGT